MYFFWSICRALLSVQCPNVHLAYPTTHTMLQRVAACCSVLLCVSHATKVYAYTAYKTTHTVLQRVAACYSVLQRVAACCIALQIPITYAHTLCAEDHKSFVLKIYFLKK